MRVVMPYPAGMGLDRAHRNLIDAAALVAMAEHLQVSPLDAQEMLDIARRLIREALDDLAGSGVARIGLCGASH
jgi:hypothetical protein